MGTVGVHVPGAGARPSHRPSHRHLQFRRRPLRDAGGIPAVPARAPPPTRSTPSCTTNRPDSPATDPRIPALARIVRHCLEKKPDERFQNFRDLIVPSRNPAAGIGSRSRAAGHRTRPRGRFSPQPAWLLSRRRRRSASLVASALLSSGACVTGDSSRPADDEISSASRSSRRFHRTETWWRSRRPRADAARSSSGFSRAARHAPVTNDDADHQLPRWLPDGSALVYFSPAAPGEVQGAIYRIPTLGGSSQRVIASIGGGDVSRSGRLACFRLEGRAHSAGHVRSRRLGCPTGCDARDAALPVSAVVTRQPVDRVPGGRRFPVGHLRTCLSAAAPSRSISRTTTDSSRV